jgi:hypothetical protein
MAKRKQETKPASKTPRATKPKAERPAPRKPAAVDLNVTGDTQAEVPVRATLADGRAVDVVLRVEVRVSVVGPATLVPTAGPALEFRLPAGGVLGLDATAPMALVATSPAGGDFVKGDGGKGTITIACTDIEGKAAILTAQHVSGGIGSEVFADTQASLGVVTQAGKSNPGLSPMDVAVVRLANGVTPDPDVRVDGQTLQIDSFRALPAVGDVVIHGGKKTGGREGKVVDTDTSATIETNNELDGGTLFKSFGLFKIASSTAEPFGVPGDSGAPVLRETAAGMFDFLGVLVAVDAAGNGYAYPTQDPNGNDVVTAFGIDSL